MYKTRIKEKWWFSQCGRTWLVCKIQVLIPAEHLWCDFKCRPWAKKSHFINFKTIATEMEIQFLSTWIMFPSFFPQCGRAFFSSKEGGVPVLKYSTQYKSFVFGDSFLAQGLHLKSHERCSAGIRTCILQTSQVLPHWLNHHFSLILALYTEALSC